METINDNSLVTIDWKQISDTIEQLNRLKNKPDAVSDIIAVTNGLHSMLLHYSVEKKNSSNINTSKRVSVVMPSVFPSIATITTIANQEKEVVETETKEFAARENAVEKIDNEEVSLANATVEEPVLDSISKIKEMELAENEEPENNTESEVKADVTENEQPITYILEEETPVDMADEVEVPVKNVHQKEKADEKNTEQSVPTIAEEQVDKIVSQETSKEESKKQKQFSIWEAYSSNEIPTLAQQQPTAKVNNENQASNAQHNMSFNIATGTSPVKDLRKAISISDRFLFINELFRGEESEYERSIKTINNFNVYQEARYWMDRELKLKLGWDEKSNTVKQFVSLVQRRFA